MTIQEISCESGTVEARPCRPVSDFRKYKTQLCEHWMESNTCVFGGSCIFAHGEQELRSETNNEMLKLASQLLGSSQELAPRRRTRKHRRKKTKSQEESIEHDEENADAPGSAAELTPVKMPRGCASLNDVLTEVLQF